MDIKKDLKAYNLAKRLIGSRGLQALCVKRINSGTAYSPIWAEQAETVTAVKLGVGKQDITFIRNKFSEQKHITRPGVERELVKFLIVFDDSENNTDLETTSIIRYDSKDYTIIGSSTLKPAQKSILYTVYCTL